MSDYQRSWIIGFFLVICLALAGFFLSANKSLQRLDLLIYDLMLPLQAPAMSDDIVIIAIDDASIQALGRWPWTRQRHAELLDTLLALSPRAIGIDLLFSEPENNSDADQSLARAMTENNRTVLVVAPIQETPDSIIIERLPIPVLALAAEALGHVDVELDIDGVNRHFYLYGGIADPHWPSMALAMLNVGNDRPIRMPPSYADKADKQTGTGWLRRHKVMLSFTSPEDKAQRISYVDVLAGRVAASAIENKYVLIGATSAGIGDMISTPANQSHQRMPGVEVISQEMNTLLQNKWLYELAQPIQSALTMILIVLSVTTLFWLPQRYSLVTMIVALLLITGCSLGLLLWPKLWFAPASALIMTLLSWPLWTVWQYQLNDRFTKKLMSQLEKQSRQHIITGLPNHGVLQEQLHKLKNLSQPNSLAALFVIHVTRPDSAISVIDRSISDSLLLTISERLKQATESDAFIAHLNEDDFAVLIMEQQDINTIQYAANRLLFHLQTPIHDFGEEIVLTPNIGLSIWPTDSRDCTELLRKAHTAMFKSRLDKTLPICIYTADIGQEIESRAELERAMSGALGRGEFEIYYQPQVEALTGRLVGAEALLRWHSPELGDVGPESFIPVAEQSGLINAIGQWVLRKACEDLKLMKDIGLDHIRIAVNLSPLQFSNMTLADEIAETLRNADIEPSRLELEVTESTLMNNMSTAVEAMMNIKKHGMSLAIDDFGTGYSSLKHLQLFPLDCLKIDKCFTQDLSRKSTAEITLSIIELARRLNLRIIAEGVETREQADFFRQHNCDELQGYLYSKPIPAKALIELMKQQASTRINFNTQ
ncbi:complex sensory protein with histidine kinase domain containing protein [Methylophaga aminisulfidivorans MP]|uniref:cyclic-guanylate-specific phosphodiesterase n=1 Tax=Methylophaga aminisulfidivorans MP TaxID=1026882 RepID=F5T327_9GAMM|nr:EAL domain-containing protein [Methylophaga aminisulfidivorans]EGL53211.1 complex sensory protein with histidine kinase domain containing protein [Methylophaga aminisulfidivorans MP]